LESCEILNGFSENLHIINISAWNALRDKVIRGTKGAMNAEVVKKFQSGKRLVSINRNGSLDTLQLAKRIEAWAVIKALNVMTAVE
jgi:molybdopterin-binding protein